MTSKIGWINECWGSTNNLQIPIDDRGLNFGDGIFETILISNKKPKLLKAHLHRWQKNAKKLGMASPPNQEILTPIINEALTKSFLDNDTGSLRLNWSRGSNHNRGIDFNEKNNEEQYRFWIELTSLKPSFKSIEITVDSVERRNANSIISQCKTFNYLQSIQARLNAINKNFDDAVLLSTTGEMCCGTTANIIIQRNGKLLTPRLESGCLPGIMRQQAIAKGLLQETRLSPIPKPNDQWLLINSLSCHPIAKIDNQAMKLFNNVERLWNSLLIE